MHQLPASLTSLCLRKSGDTTACLRAGEELLANGPCSGSGSRCVKCHAVALVWASRLACVQRGALGASSQDEVTAGYLQPGTRVE